MTSVQLLILLLEIQILAVAGSAFFVWFQKKFQWTNKSLVMLHLTINAMLPLYGMIGLIPGAPLGVVTIWELYVFTGLCYAFHLGSILSLSRSLFGHMIPEGKESQLFGLYEFTNKGSSWIGPLLSTFIITSLSLRWVFLYMFLFFSVAVPILRYKVDYEQGMIHAGKVKPTHTATQKHTCKGDSETSLKSRLLKGQEKSNSVEGTREMSTLGVTRGVESYGAA